MTHSLLIVGDPKGSHSLTAINRGGYDPADITVWEDHPRHVYSIKQISDKITVVSDFLSLDMHFSQTIGNPPYLKNIHLEFMLKSLQISDSVSLIHPAGWLFRDTKKIEREVKSALKGRVKKLVLFNGNATFKGAEFACPLVRTYAVKSHTGPIEVQSEITGNTYYINDLSEFPTGYWEPTDLHLEVINVIKNIPSEGDINSLVKVRSNKPFLGCPAVVGHGKTTKSDKYASDDFHVFHYKNSDLFNSKRTDKVFELNNNNEVKSLKSYFETKFARFALSITKVSQHLYIGRYLENVPLPPLDRQWTDDSIMKFYSISQEHSDYIKNFIPDYYQKDLHNEVTQMIIGIALDNNVTSLIKDNTILGCPRVVGHGKTMDPNKYASDDFHIFHYKNSDVYNSNTGDKVFQLNNNQEVESLKSYLETKFARFGLSISKISQDSYVSRYFESVPLPPLDRQWTDESVNEFYSLSVEHCEYIDSFIPDYY